jgi:hypothetical protein
MVPSVSRNVGKQLPSDAVTSQKYGYEVTGLNFFAVSNVFSEYNPWMANGD